MKSIGKDSGTSELPGVGVKLSPSPVAKKRPRQEVKSAEGQHITDSGDEADARSPDVTDLLRGDFGLSAAERVKRGRTAIKKTDSVPSQDLTRQIGAMKKILEPPQTVRLSQRILNAPSENTTRNLSSLQKPSSMSLSNALDRSSTHINALSLSSSSALRVDESTTYLVVPPPLSSQNQHVSSPSCDEPLSFHTFFNTLSLRLMSPSPSDAPFCKGLHLSMRFP